MWQIEAFGTTATREGKKVSHRNTKVGKFGVERATEGRGGRLGFDMATASAIELEEGGPGQRKTKQKIVLEETKRAARGRDRAEAVEKNMPHKLRLSSRDSLNIVGLS